MDMDETQNMMGIEQDVILTNWGFKWIKFAYNYIALGGPAEVLAKVLIKHLDSVNEDPDDYVDETCFTSLRTIKTEQEDGTVKCKMEKKEQHIKKLSKGKRSCFAASIAKMAYNKFGQREMSKPNVLVTRKWIQKYLEDAKYKDLRTSDKNLAIDRALFLSFIPTAEFNRMRLVMESTFAKNRVDGKSPFGRIFRLAEDDDQ